MPEYNIEIVDYDSAWPTLFEREAERMRSVVGDHVISIEHVGSTSVPGLAAKPIVDICPVVEDMNAACTVSDLLDEAGWPLARERGDKPWIEHQRIAESGQEYNIHIRPCGAAVERYFLFREYLRDRPEIRNGVRPRQARGCRGTSPRRRELHGREKRDHRAVQRASARGRIRELCRPLRDACSPSATCAACSTHSIGTVSPMDALHRRGTSRNGYDHLKARRPVRTRFTDAEQFALSA